MIRRGRWLKVAVLAWGVLVVAEKALAFDFGPLSFSFATGFLNNVFLAPLALGGCVGF